MARILPDQPQGAFPGAVLTVFRAIKQVLPGDYQAWHRLAIHPAPGPDFLLLGSDRAALQVKVSTLSPRQLEAHVAPDLFSGQPPPGGLPEQPVTDEQLSDDGAALRRFADDLGWPELYRRCPCALVFPLLDQLDRLPRKDLVLPRGVTCYAAPALRGQTFIQLVAGLLCRPLPDEALDRLRRAFTPEALVPRGMTTRRVRHDSAARLTGFFLDYDQERALKQDLAPPPETDALARRRGVRLVNGVAGSGKSILVVYRAHLLRRFHPGSRILVLTHNRALIRDLRQRYRLLAGDDADPGGVRWYTFLGWCFPHLPRDGRRLRAPLAEAPRWRLIRQIWRDHLRQSPISADLLSQEIGWYKDQDFSRPEDYLEADRGGRGFGLRKGGDLRRQLLAAMKAYQQALARRRALDWYDLPRIVARQLRRGRLRPRPYNFILIDEAQFFAPVWFEIVKRLLEPRQGQLFMVADPTQGFLKRRQSWLQVGIDVRGRSTRLRQSYRTTREIMEFATRFYWDRVGQDDDEIVRPTLSNMPRGPAPRVVRLHDPQDELNRVVNEVLQLKKAGVPLRDLLLVHADPLQVKPLITRLRRRLGRGAAINPKQQAWTDQARAIGLAAATGLESPIVMVLGLDRLFEPEGDPSLTAEQRSELARDNTRKAYMAFTRAGQRLALFCAGDLPDELKIG